MQRFGALVIALLAASAGGFIEAGYISAPSAAQAAAAAHFFYVAGIIFAIFFATERPAD
jgi:hypothetical protein